MRSLMADYDNFIPFNEKLISGYREEDDIKSHVEKIYKTLEQSGFIKVISTEYITDESKIPSIEKDGKYWLSLSSSRLNMLKIKYLIDEKYKVGKDGVVHKLDREATIFIPKLINKYYYLLNGTKYYSIYQVVDESTYNTKNGVHLKSLTMSLVLNESDPVIITDTNGISYEGKTYVFNLFKKKLNILYYFLAGKGFDKTLEYFTKHKYVSVGDDAKLKDKDEIAFQVSKKLVLFVNKKKFNKDPNTRTFVFCIHEMLQKCDLDKIDETNFWLLKLGIFTKNTNNKLNKAETVLKSFERILSDGTRDVLRIPDKDKEDVYAIAAWMCRNFEKLKQKDNYDLKNKRLRLTEYVVNDLQKIFSNKTYTLLNSNKTIDAEKISSLASINPFELVNLFTKCSLMRYQNAVNDMDFFNVVLKRSARGPQAVGESSKQTISDKHRDIHPSHLGRYDITTHSANDPGMTGYVVPFANLYDNMYFSEDGEIFLEEE